MKSSLEGIEKSDIVIICFSGPYTESDCCLKELKAADRQKKQLVMVKLDPDAETKGEIDMILGDHIWVSFSL